MKESEISKFFKEYRWEKCSRNQYYKNIKKWMTKEEAIKKVERKTKAWKIYSKRFIEELLRYTKYEWPKPPRWRFYQRLYQWRTKEEAIKLDVELHYKTFCKDRKKKSLYKKKFEKTSQSKDIWIDIKYSKEEADVFKSFYEKMMKEIEIARFETDDVEEARALMNKLQELKAEYELFISVNNYYE